MLEGSRVVDRLEESRRDGASRDEILRSAVREIEEAEDHFDWVGIYLLEDDDTLVLHNYIGRPTDHDRIPVGEGVCGEAVAEGRDINVPDVEERENYLACSVETRSELVVLIRDGEDGQIHGQIDLDSDEPAAFDERDRRELRAVADWLAGLF
ncbi:MAG: GAF domain-containing protein [Gemmatimonadota bacterium]